MSNKTVNLAGKDLVVNSIKSMRGASEQEYMLSAVKGSTKRNTQTATANLTRLGARANASDSTSIDIYACDPRKAYSTNYGDSFYVDTAYATFNGLPFPVYIRTKKVTLSPDRNGTWAIVIKRVAGSEVWGVHIAFPSPVTAGGQTTMSWQEPGSVSFAIDATTWVVGSFIYDSDITSPNYGVYGIVMHNEALTPASFLKDRFMQIIGDAEGSDTDDFTSWAVAMGCDAIFKRLAALEAFVGNFYANYVTIGPETVSTTSGFRFRAHRDGGPNNTPIFDVYYNDRMVFSIDTTSGDILFGDKFRYHASQGKIDVVDASISGRSNFGDVLLAVPMAETEYSITNASVVQAYSYVTYLIAQGLLQDTFYSCSLGDDTTIAYLKFHRNERTENNETLRQDSIWFYDENFVLLDIRVLYPEEAKYYELPSGTGNPRSYLYTQSLGLSIISTYLDISGLTLTVYTGGNRLQANIPDSITAQDGAALTRGQLYYDVSTGVVKMSLNSQDPSD